MTIIKKTALVYCEKEFGLVDGKTAAGLVDTLKFILLLGFLIVH